MEEWKLYSRPPASGGRPKNVVLMLHGWGANGQDLIGLASYLAPALPEALFLSPDAPEVCETSPFGRQWFSLRSFDPDFMRRGADEAGPALNGLIDKVLAEYALEDQDLALLGFSQGTMMALYAAPRRKKPLAGVLGYSGALLGGAELDAPEMNRIPICLVHGDADPVVPVHLYHEAEERLKRAGFPVEGLLVPGLQHSIDESGLKAGSDFLRRVLKA